jgi:hypothetical protein
MSVERLPNVGDKVIVHGRHARVESVDRDSYSFEYRLLAAIDEAAKRGIPACEVDTHVYNVPGPDEDTLSFVLDRADEGAWAA